MSTELAQKSTNRHRKAQTGTERHKYKEHYRIITGHLKNFSGWKNINFSIFPFAA
jgi:hypothetical protein